MVVSDEELLYLMMSGSELAFYELYNIYYHLVWKTVYEIVGKESYLIDIEDVVSETLSVFMKLVYHYRSDRNASFRTYIKTCIKHRIYTSLKNQYRLSVRNNQIIYLDDIIDDQQSTIGEYVLKTSDDERPDVKMMIKEDIEMYNRFSLKKLTPKENAVYNYLQLGYTPKDISEILNISLKSCYNAAYRVSKKLSDFNMTLTRQKKCVKLK